MCRYIEKFEDGRVWFFGTIIENVFKPSFGLNIEFSTQEWQIIICVGYIFGRVWFQIPHHFLYNNFRFLFDGKKFGERGREIGFMIEPRYATYSLWWFSDCNKPSHPWRSRYFFFGKKGTL